MAVDERNVARKMAKALALLCVGNSFMEYLHDGKRPFSKKGDYSDVIIRDANGDEVAWNKACHISDEERDKLIKDIVDGISDFLLNVETEEYSERLESAYEASQSWGSSSSKKRHC